MYGLVCKHCGVEVYQDKASLVHVHRDTQVVWCAKDGAILMAEPQDGTFWHRCEDPECDRHVEFDDEPYCFTHSPYEGSSVRGYSARKNAEAL